MQISLFYVGMQKNLFAISAIIMVIPTTDTITVTAYR